MNTKEAVHCGCASFLFVTDCNQLVLTNSLKLHHLILLKAIVNEPSFLGKLFDLLEINCTFAPHL